MQEIKERKSTRNTPLKCSNFEYISTKLKQSIGRRKKNIVPNVWHYIIRNIQNPYKNKILKVQTNSNLNRIYFFNPCL